MYSSADAPETRVNVIDGVVHGVMEVESGKKTDGALDVYAVRMLCGEVVHVPFGQQLRVTETVITCLACLADSPLQHELSRFDAAVLDQWHRSQQ